MKIAVIEDGIGKYRKIESECEKRGIDTEILHDLESAIVYLRDSHDVDGIITDMQYPLRKGGDVKMAGNRLLEWLLQEKMEIPVLGNSHLDFDSEYPYFTKKMNGYFEEHIFQEFVSLIGGHD